MYWVQDITKFYLILNKFVLRDFVLGNRYNNGVF